MKNNRSIFINNEMEFLEKAAKLMELSNIKILYFGLQKNDDILKCSLKIVSETDNKKLITRFMDNIPEVLKFWFIEDEYKDEDDIYQLENRPVVINELEFILMDESLSEMINLQEEIKLYFRDIVNHLKQMYPNIHIFMPSNAKYKQSIVFRKK